LSGAGPDVSEVGMNWVANLLAMEALRPYHESELETLDGQAFLDSSWRSGRLLDDQAQSCWAVPWLADTRVMYYRRDWLRQADIDEQTAFQSHRQLVQTLDTLRACGLEHPLVLPTTFTLETLHNVASWVWGAGGDFISLRPLRTLFGDAPACAGIAAYLSLYRYLPPRPLDSRLADVLFRQGRAAVTMSGAWFLQTGAAHDVNDGQPADIGVAPPPGVPFVGGSNLVVWKRTRQPNLAIELVRFLTSQPVQQHYCPRAGLLPVRLDVLHAPPFSDDLSYRLMSAGLKAGRSFPALSAWGLIEDRLTAELTGLWAEAQSDQNFELALDERLSALASQLDAALAETTVPFWV
jgi:multiple sugar transport system substrate-binding protein